MLVTRLLIETNHRVQFLEENGLGRSVERVRTEVGISFTWFGIDHFEYIRAA